MRMLHQRVWLALPLIGEFHGQSQPSRPFHRSASHGLRRGELEPSDGIIAILEGLGIALVT